MAKQLTPPKLERININDGFFKIEDRVYFIQPDQISPKRFKVYTELTTKGLLGASFEDIFKSYKRIYDASTSCNDVIKALNTCASESYKMMVAVRERTDYKLEPILHLCALFCNQADENISNYDERVIFQKTEDFLSSNIHLEDFFYLAGLLIDGLKELLESIPDKESTAEEAIRAQGLKKG